MKRNLYLFSIQRGAVFLLLLLLCFACEKEVKKVDFTLNGRSVISSDVEPTDPADSLKQLYAFPGDTIYVKDNSEDQRYVKRRAWFTNGEPISGTDNLSFFPVFFDSEGIYKITLVVNDNKPGVSKWINVQGDPGPIWDSVPVVRIQEPYDGQAFKGSSERRVKVEAFIDNVFEKNELRFLVNGKSKSFKFDPAVNLLTAKVRLSRGENTIGIEAETFEGEDSKNIVVSYSAGKPKKKRERRKEPEPRQEPPPPPPAPLVKINSPMNNFKSKVARQEINIKSKGLRSRDDLTVTLNGRRIENMRFSSKRGMWVGEVDLEGGKNTIEARVSTPSGNATDRIAIDYLKDKPAPETLGTIALPGSKFIANCVNYTAGNYSFSITPKQDIDLLSFTMFSNICGGLEVELSAGSQSEKIKVALVKGKNQILLSDLTPSLEAGTTYRISCKSIAGYGRCDSDQNPKLADATDCQLTNNNQPHLNVDYHVSPLFMTLNIYTDENKNLLFIDNCVFADVCWRGDGAVRNNFFRYN